MEKSKLLRCPFAEIKHKLKRENLRGKRKHGFQLDALLVNVVDILENQMSMIQKKKQSKHGIGGLKMQENKMEQVAKLFDKTLDEEFTVEDKYKAKWHCKFTKMV